MHINCKKILKADQEISGTPTSQLDAPETKAKDLSVNNFKGSVVYSPLGNNKYKGSAKIIKGNIEINLSKILLTEGNVLDSNFP